MSICWSLFFLNIVNLFSHWIFTGFLRNHTHIFIWFFLYQVALIVFDEHFWLGSCFDLWAESIKQFDEKYSHRLLFLIFLFRDDLFELSSDPLSHFIAIVFCFDGFVFNSFQIFNVIYIFIFIPWRSWDLILIDWSTYFSIYSCFISWTSWSVWLFNC